MGFIFSLFFVLFGTEIFAEVGHGTNEHTFVEVTPTVSSGSAYSANDQVGGIQVLTGAIWDSDGIANLNNIAILDKDTQAGTYTIYFFDESPTVVSVDNGAIDVSDAEMADKFVGSVLVGTYASLANNTTVGTSTNSNRIALRSVDRVGGQGKSGKLYALVKTSGTPTFTSTSALVFKYTFEQ